MASDQEIKPGDVLLFRGRSFISWGIRFFDGSEVNHAALAVDGGQLAEAAGNGLRLYDLGKAVGSSDRTLVRRIKTGAPSDPVVALAQDFVARKLPYAYQQILLLAILCLTRRLPLKNPVLRRAVRAALDRSASLLNSLVDAGKELMICSEFVYRCFDEAVGGVGDPYLIELLALVSKSAPARSLQERPLSLHPGSLGDFLIGTDLRSIEATPREPSTEDPELLAADAEGELEPLLESLAAEFGVAGAGPRALPPTIMAGEVGEEELASSARRFAAALSRSKAARRGLVKGQGDLPTAVADFVTPGDLLRSPSLFDAGSISR